MMTQGSNYFRFKQFVVHQDRDVMRVNTDGVLLGAWTPDVAGRRILEIGTGTGVVALQLLQRGASQVDAIDIDAIACEQAFENAQGSPWKEQMTVQQISFQEYAESCETSYDLIVSNPPYYIGALPSPNERKNRMRHADTLPLDDLLAGLELCLSGDGRFVAIFPLAEGSLFVAKAVELELYCTHQILIADSPQKRTKRMLCEFCRKRAIPQIAELYIRDSSGNYSQEYRELTKNFYLEF
ncbi:MAG: tRNA1(Val) (adenine(37)-N6)-methyltransferase [Bacteroides sp.]